MSNRHELKTLPVYFNAVVRGDKTFEIRKNDRDFQTGDTLVLREWDPGYPPLPRAPGYFTGNMAEAVVSYTLHGGRFGLAEDHVILGLHDVIYSNGGEKE